MFLTGILLAVIGGIFSLLFTIQIIAEIIAFGDFVIGWIVIISISIILLIIGIYLINKGKKREQYLQNQKNEIIKLKKEIEIEKYKKELNELKNKN